MRTIFTTSWFKIRRTRMSSIGVKCYISALFKITKNYVLSSSIMLGYIDVNILNEYMNSIKCRIGLSILYIYSLKLHLTIILNTTPNNYLDMTIGQPE